MSPAQYLRSLERIGYRRALAKYREQYGQDPLERSQDTADPTAEPKQRHVDEEFVQQLVAIAFLKIGFSIERDDPFAGIYRDELEVIAGRNCLELQHALMLGDLITRLEYVQF